MRKDADFTGKIKSAVAGGGRNRYNKDSVFLSLDIEETTGGQYADNRNQRNMDSTLCKISLDDGNVGESMSIQSQKAILTRKAEELGIYNYRFYVDDGYSGTNFDEVR